jgi:hypothetical protein
MTLQISYLAGLVARKVEMIWQPRAFYSCLINYGLSSSRTRFSYRRNSPSILYRMTLSLHEKTILYLQSKYGSLFFVRRPLRRFSSDRRFLLLPTVLVSSRRISIRRLIFMVIRLMSSLGRLLISFMISFLATLPSPYEL